MAAVGSPIAAFSVGGIRYPLDPNCGITVDQYPENDCICTLSAL